MATSICGCAREEGVFLPCQLHKKMMDDANGFTAALVNHQTEALRNELKETKLQIRDLEGQVDVLQKTCFDHIGERDVALRLISEARELLQAGMEWIRVDPSAEEMKRCEVVEQSILTFLDKTQTLKRKCECNCHARHPIGNVACNCCSHE